MKIEVDWTRCVGLGLCEGVSPDHFEIQDDGKLLVLHAGTDDADLAEIREAVQACPTSALKLVP